MEEGERKVVPECEREAGEPAQMRAICQRVRATGKRCENGRGLTCKRFVLLCSFLPLPLGLLFFAAFSPDVANQATVWNAFLLQHRGQRIPF